MTFPFCSVTLEALEWFRRNLTQMLTRLRRRAEAMLRIAGFKVKVRLRDQRTYDCFPFPSVTLEALERFRRNLTQMLTSLRWRAEAMFRMAGFKVKVILRGQRPYDFFSLPLCNSWTPWRISKKPDSNVHQTETMVQKQCFGWLDSRSWTGHIFKIQLHIWSLYWNQGCRSNSLQCTTDDWCCHCLYI